MDTMPFKYWIKDRSPRTRWILVPIVFIASASLIHGLVILFSKLLTLVWEPSHIGINTYIFKNIIANGFSAFYSCAFSGWTAPKFKVVTTCICAGLYLLINLVGIYGMITTPGWWGWDTIWIILSTTVGAIIAIWYARENFSDAWDD